MRRLPFLLLLVSSLAFGQGAYYKNVASTASYINGTHVLAVIDGATVQVCTTLDGTCTLVPVFSDEALTIPLANPVATDFYGNFGFWVAPGSYAYRILDKKGILIESYYFTAGGSGSGGGTLAGDVTGPATANTVVKVNGAAVPASTTVVGTDGSSHIVAATTQGNGAKVQLAAGTATAGHVPVYDANSNLIDSGSGPGVGVTSLNTLTGALNITAGPNITVTPSGSGIQIAGSPGFSPLTTKGDLFGFNVANARIPVGADGTVLTADSTQAAGVKWGTGGGGSGCAAGTCVVNNPSANQTVTQPSGTNFMANVLNQQYWANLFGTGSNGIETVYGDNTKCIAQDATASTGCSIMVPPLYTNADNPSGWGSRDFGGQVNGLQMPAGAAAYDYRNGVLQMAFRDPGSVAPLQESGLSISVTEDSTAKTRYSFANAGIPTPLKTQMNAYANGFNFNNYFNGIPRYSYGNFYYGQNISAENWTGGQTFGQQEIVNCHATGDCLRLWTKVVADGGINTSEDEGVEGVDELVTEDPLVYTGTLTSGAGTTTLFTTASIGGGTQGQDRLLVDTTQVAFNGTKWTAQTASLNAFPPAIADSTKTFPVSTMVSLCYPGSDNGAGGAAGCTPGSVPSGYIPGQADSDTTHTPLPSITTNVDATYSGLPAGFCTSANLQSSNSGAACYMPASGTGCLTSPEEYETVNYTYDSATQKVTLLNLTFPHSNNGLTFATGGLCGYAIEDRANQYTDGGTTGVIDPVYPIEGSVDTHTIYYITQRTNEGYGSPLLGGSTDGGTGNGTGSAPPGYAQMCFSTSSFGYSLAGGTVTFSMNAPAGTSGNETIYNGLTANIAANGDASYNGNNVITWVRDNVFTYTPLVGPSGTVPTSGTISYCNASYKIEPSARITSVYNTASNKVDGTIYVMPNEAPFANGDSIMIPHYQQMAIQGNHVTTTAFQPEQYLGQRVNNFDFAGTISGPEWGVFISNNAPASQYLGYGGTHALPTQALEIDGPWSRSIGFGNAPDSAVLNVNGCKAGIGCSSELSNFNMLAGPPLASQNPQPGANGQDVLNYDSNFQSSARTQGLFSGRWYFTNGGGGGGVTQSNSFATVQAGYLTADQFVTGPTVVANNVLTAPMTNINVFPNTVGTPGSTTYNYWVVGHALVNPTTAKTTPIAFSLTTGNATLNGTNYNMLCFPHQAGWDSYDILKGDTAHSIVTGLSATTPNGASMTPPQPANYSCFADQGGATSAYTAPTSNTTGGANFVGPVEMETATIDDLIGNDGCLHSVNGVVESTGTACGSGGGGLPSGTGIVKVTSGTGALASPITDYNVPIGVSLANYHASALPVTYGNVTNASNVVTVTDASSWSNGEGIFIPAVSSAGGYPATGVHCDNVTVSGNTITMFNVGGSACNAGWTSGSNSVPVFHFNSSHGAITSGTNTLTMASAVTFTAGQGIMVEGAGASGADLICPVIGVSGTTFTLFQSDGTTACNAGTTVSAAKVFHDDTLALKNALAAGTYVRAPSGAYFLSSEVDIANAATLYGDGLQQSAFISTENGINTLVVKSSGVTVKNLGIYGSEEFTPTGGNLVTLCDGTAPCFNDNFSGLMLYGGWISFGVNNKAIQGSFAYSTIHKTAGVGIYVNNNNPYGDINFNNIQGSACASPCSNTAIGIQIDAADTNAWNSVKMNSFGGGNLKITGSLGDVDHQRFNNASFEGGAITIQKLSTNAVFGIQFTGGEFEPSGGFVVGNGVTGFQATGARIYQGTHGFDIAGQGATLTGNTIEGTSSDGVLLESTASEVSVTANSFRTIGGFGINNLGTLYNTQIWGNTFASITSGNYSTQVTPTVSWAPPGGVPTATFVNTGTGNGSSALFIEPSLTNGGYTQIWQGAGNASGLYPGDGGNTGYWNVSHGSACSSEFMGTTGGGNPLTVTQGGKVGIGVALGTCPQALLEVNGKSQFDDALYVSSAGVTAPVITAQSNYMTSPGEIPIKAIQSYVGASEQGAVVGQGDIPFEGFKDATPTEAYALSYGVPGALGGNNPTFAYYNGAWNEAWHVDSTTGDFNVKTSITVPKITVTSGTPGITTPSIATPIVTGNDTATVTVIDGTGTNTATCTGCTASSGFVTYSVGATVPAAPAAGVVQLNFTALSSNIHCAIGATNVAGAGVVPFQKATGTSNFQIGTAGGAYTTSTSYGFSYVCSN